MITSNFRKVMALLFETLGSSNTQGLISAVNTAGATKYLGGRFSEFPYNIQSAMQYSANNAGFYIGRGNTPATENDYFLESQITSGITTSLPTVTFNVDGNGNPYKDVLFALTNTSASDITINEVGYGQSLNCSNTLTGNTTSTFPFLLDRTVLTEPLVIPANSSAVLKYQLKTIIS